MNVSSVCVKRLCAVVLGGLALGLTAPVLASELPAAAPGPMATTGKVMASLVLILVMIAGLALLARRLQHLKWLQTGRQDDVAIRTAGVLNLGVKEKLLVVDVGGKRLLLGVTSQQITTLAELPLESSAEQAFDQQQAETSTVFSSASEAESSVAGAGKTVGSQAITSAFAEVLKKTLARV
ncbi:flagellar biosynthetic protein FliO [Parathalassolituus penaei]|uniref:Flagellar protein n=1 Tax=Parathalassolituus penaei TaxID=2997323 RepID=A0A9X3EEC0_9GAMM|nr:flagellar biosynthetic protein FliO [Parathalassolituus penaei]MCY0966033.1 flagellar biosynthetic protein FliO [Parathalassolituus penaei]